MGSDTNRYRSAHAAERRSNQTCIRPTRRSIDYAPPSAIATGSVVERRPTSQLPEIYGILGRSIAKDQTPLIARSSTGFQEKLAQALSNATVKRTLELPRPSS